MQSFPVAAATNCPKFSVLKECRFIRFYSSPLWVSTVGSGRRQSCVPPAALGSFSLLFPAALGKLGGRSGFVFILLLAFLSSYGQGLLRLLRVHPIDLEKSLNSKFRCSQRHFLCLICIVVSQDLPIGRGAWHLFQGAVGL